MKPIGFTANYMFILSWYSLIHLQSHQRLSCAGNYKEENTEKIANRVHASVHSGEFSEGWSLLSLLGVRRGWSHPVERCLDPGAHRPRHVWSLFTHLRPTSLVFATRNLSSLTLCSSLLLTALFLRLWFSALLFCLLDSELLEGRDRVSLTWCPECQACCFVHVRDSTDVLFNFL